MPYACLVMSEIDSWEDFHEASRTAFGFPDFYGMNNNAWIDCLSYLDDGDGMSTIVLGRDEVLDVLLEGYDDFAEKHPEMALAITRLFAFVNQRYESPRLRLSLR